MHDSLKHAGEIVRINLENFMSYDNIEIKPGHNLNLIIGPNGNGKSSIVCAVLLGLGGKLSTLGRADRLGSYVKSGCNQSCIEIELYEPKGSNVVIKRKILSNNQSEFIINGKISTPAKVAEIRKKYNIQIDNLCTFLPQEKVQDFAKLNPQQLLDQTQRILANGNLLQLHEELKRLQLKTADQEKHNSQLQDELDNEKQKNERLQDKIKCFKEKQSLCEKLVLLNQKKAWLYYKEEVKNKNEIENDTKLAENAFNEKKKELEKCKKALTQFEYNLNSYQEKLVEAKRNETGKRVAMEDSIKRAERKISQREDLINTLKARLEEEENKKREMLEYKERVEKLKNDLKTLDSTIGSEQELHKQQAEVGKKFGVIQAEESRLNQIKSELEEDEDTLRHEARNTTAEYQNLQRRRNIRLEYLKRHEPDVYKSMEWLEKNRNLFQGHIYNPMLLELDVPNSKMAKFIEARLGYKDLISFTCTNPDDLNLLIKKLRTEQKLKVNAICSDEYENTQYSPEVPLSSLKCYGFYAYLRDLITGPEDIIRFLCKTYKFHNIPVGDERVKANCNKIPQTIPIFYSDNHFFSVKYSVYSGDKSITVKKLSESKFFAESIDERRIQILMEREKEIENKLKNKQNEIKDVDNQLNQLRIALDEVKKRKRQLGTSLEERQQIQCNLKRALTKYNFIKEALKDPAEIKEEADRQRMSLTKEIQRNLEDIKKASEEVEKATLSRQKSELQFKINKLGKNQLLENKSLLMEELDRKERLWREMKERQRAAECKCKQLKDKAVQLTENISIEEKGFKKFQEKFDKLPKNVDDIENEIEETQVKADFLQCGNIEVLHDYERREEQILQLTTSLENSRKDLENKKLEIQSKRNEWLDPINELVANINNNFSKFFETMECAGEVCLISGENKDDFDQYGIKILVKFRDGTPLQELGRHFQSGGERAVATAIFMLSLQELTSVPFRFVDEINQGMDPINERRIFQLIVKVTSPKHSTQYFFVTPKLLTDLECSKTMTVHCIYNGPKAIPASEWDFNSFLDLDENSDDSD